MQVRAAGGRGFTIVEMMVVVAIIGVVATITIGALGGLKQRGTYVAASGDLLVGIRRTRAEAYGRGNTTIFVVDSIGGRWWSIADPNDTFSLATFDPASPAAAAGVVLLDNGTFPTGVSFGPAAGYGALPRPFAIITATSPCSFCKSGAPNDGFGAISFRTTGGATFAGAVGAATAAGGSVVVQGTATAGKYTMAIAVVGRTGASQTYERMSP